MTIFPIATVFRPTAVVAITACVFLSAAFTSISPVFAQGLVDTSLLYIESADGTRSADNFSVIRNTHARLSFQKDIARIAVGDPLILEMDVLNGREILTIARQVGKTSVIVWYTDGTAEPLMFDVVEDLTVLVGVLRDIDPNIVIEMAPDRAALILRGTVPTIRTKVEAEAAARSYLSSNASGSFEIFTPSTSSTDSDAVIPIPRIAIINLLKTDEIALSVEQRIIEAVGVLSKGVTVKRAPKGQVADDSVDTFLLEGEVENQIVLTRVLSVAASIIGVDGSEILVVSDEGGGIAGGEISLIGTNIARAKILSVAEGRIISMIHVRNIPQVRIAVKIHEVNRSLLRDWKPKFTATTNNYTTAAALGEPSLTAQSSDPSQFTLRDIDIGNALQVIKGTMTNNVQIATQDVAFDILFGMMEEAGISRSLSNPTITVLSGEEAVFEVGGQVPVPSSFTPESSGVVLDGPAPQLQAGTYSRVEFKQYGVTLRVFPLVDENNLITLDVQPEISQPDIVLTRQIAEASGGASATAAFNTRSLQTRAQVIDGQPMVIGGLITRTASDVEGYPQGIGNLPGIGGLAKYSSRQEQTQELVIIVTPTIVLQPLKNDGLWQYPSMSDLLEQAVGIPGRDSLSSALRTEAMYQ
jgi:Flp pilus assembly secretin CpaC